MKAKENEYKKTIEQLTREKGELHIQLEELRNDINNRNNQANNEGIELLKKQLNQERILKSQAVNKLAEIMNRKEMSLVGVKKNKVSASDLRKKEKECRRLEQELTQVGLASQIMLNQLNPFFGKDIREIYRTKDSVV